ncbi:MAG TPA: iron-containing redox enzyme family protein [Acidobacteriaceae bacterium]|jgi:pyrroloquinoline-quinone synthase|nr:iron-containing redox enzyme family protein [Acidobacteriaceae bacterium]
MNLATFQLQLDQRIAPYDLLCHPFYKAWSAGELTRADLRDYAAEYFHQIDGFPACLEAFAARLEDGPARRAVLSNLADEQGRDSEHGGGVPHPELWLDFAEGMGADREAVRRSTPSAAITDLTAHFEAASAAGAPEAALAAFYAFESQVPRVAREKARGLRAWYGATDTTCRYFTLHGTADVHHANVWKQLVSRRVAANPQLAEPALAAAEDTARALWTALDGIQARRLARAA